MSSSLLQTSDFYVSPLPKALIEKCRVMYDLYINTIQNENNIIASPTSPASPTTTVNNNNKSSSSKTDEMLPSTLAKLLEDLGVPTTENDARALVFSLSQNAALQISAEESVQRKRVMEHQLLQHQQQQANSSENATASSSGKRGAGNQRTGARGRATTGSSVDQRSNSRRSSVHSQSPRGKAGGQHPSSSSPMSFTSAAVRLEAPPPSARITLSFDMFLRVLQMPFNKSTREMEMQLLWNELDRDGDGVLSRSDIAQSIARMNGMTSKGVPKEVCESAMNFNNNQNKNKNNKNQNGDHHDGQEEDDDEDRLSMESASDFGDDSTDENDATSNGDGANEKNTRKKNNLHDDPHTSGRRQIIRGEATAATRTNRTALSKAFASSKPNSRSASKTATVSKMKMTTTTSTSSPKNQQRQSKQMKETSSSSSSSFDMLFQSPWMLEELSEHQLEALIHQLDSDGDGTVTFNDLKESLLNA